MTNFLFDMIKNVKYDDILRDLVEELRAKIAPEELEITSMAVAYSLYKTQSGADFIGNPNNEEVEHILNHYVPMCWDIMLSHMNKYSNEMLLAFLLLDHSFDNKKGQNVSTPDSISKLVCSILNVQDDETVLELCSGKGNFPIELCKFNENANYRGIEVERFNKEIAILRLSLLPINATFMQEDALEYQRAVKSDKLFSNYPLMIRTNVLRRQKEHICKNIGIDPEIIQKCSSDWLFNLVMIDHMKEEGRAVSIMTNGASWNQADEKIRQYFIENGYVEAVISLPGKIFQDSSVNVMMIIFSYDNDRVRMIDAGHLSVSEHKGNFFTDENITEIVWLLDHDSRVSTTKTIEELSENKYILNASRYIDSVPEIENGVEFGSVIKKITRGFQIKAKDLEKLKSEEETSYQYLMISNINDGVISFQDETQFLNEIPAKAMKYCVKNNAIVLSKIGIPEFKSAVAKISGNRNLLATGNMFVIEINEEKANPFFIQSFFSSEEGKSLLNNIHTGAAMPTISIEKLKRMQIPLPEMKIQNKIADEYEDSIAKISMLKKELKKEIMKMSKIYDELS